MSKPKLSYFSSRGLLEPIRILLADANVDYIKNDLGSFHESTAPDAFLNLKATGVCFLSSSCLFSSIFSPFLSSLQSSSFLFSLFSFLFSLFFFLFFLFSCLYPPLFGLLLFLLFLFCF